jgi:hypothetical protein
MQVPVEVLRNHADYDVSRACLGLNPSSSTVKADVSEFCRTLKRTADALARNVSPAAFRLNAGGIADRDVSCIGGGLDFAALDKSDRSACLEDSPAGDVTCTDAAGSRMEFGITTDIANFKPSALTPQFSISA